MRSCSWCGRQLSTRVALRSEVLLVDNNIVLFLGDHQKTELLATGFMQHCWGGCMRSAREAHFLFAGPLSRSSMTGRECCSSDVPAVTAQLHFCWILYSARMVQKWETFKEEFFTCVAPLWVRGEPPHLSTLPSAAPLQSLSHKQSYMIVLQNFFPFLFAY